MYPTFRFDQDRVLIEFISSKVRNRNFDVGDVVVRKLKNKKKS